MFASIFQSAQTALDSAIGQLVKRLIIAVPFLIAAGFAVAYGYIKLDRAYGAEMASLVMVVSFCILGLLSLAIVDRSPATSGTPVDETANSDPQSEPSEAAESTYSQADKELLFASLTSVAPLALPAVAKLVLRNLPIVLAIVSALFIFNRAGETDRPGESRTQV